MCLCLPNCAAQWSGVMPSLSGGLMSPITTLKYWNDDGNRVKGLHRSMWIDYSSIQCTKLIVA